MLSTLFSVVARWLRVFVVRAPKSPVCLNGCFNRIVKPQGVEVLAVASRRCISAHCLEYRRHVITLILKRALENAIATLNRHKFPAVPAESRDMALVNPAGSRIFKKTARRDPVLPLLHGFHFRPARARSQALAFNDGRGKRQNIKLEFAGVFHG